MSLSSGFKAAGPTLGSVAFAWSLTSPSLDVHFTFAICALLAALTTALAWRSFLPPPCGPSVERAPAAAELAPARADSTTPYAEGSPPGCSSVRVTRQYL